MLRFLTHKLKTQTLSEVQPFQEKIDDDRDSGTESDEENAELEEIEREMEKNRKNLGADATVFNPSLINQKSNSMKRASDLTTTVDDPLSDSDQDCDKDTSDFERHSFDFERHSSEEELSVINGKEMCKRKWSEANTHCPGDDSSDSSDEEVSDLLSKPQPILFSSSPPKGIKRIGKSPPEKFFIANVRPLEVCAVSPRKRTRQSSASDNNGDTARQRPCLDFEKMQQKYFKSSGKIWKRIGRRD